MKTAIILSLLSFLFHIQTNAQNTIEGRVTDKVTRQPLESATVTLQQEGDGNIINYTLTDVDGRFQLSSSSLKDTAWLFLRFPLISFHKNAVICSVFQF